jgi:general stress protein YciG
MASSNQGNKQSGSQGSGTSNRGFASMDPERQREIASEGGKAAHEKGTAHEFTSEEARRAGSMSHGNRQSDRTSTRSSKQSGGKQSEQGGSRSGRSESESDTEGGNRSSSGGNKSGSSGGSNKSR